MISAIEGDASLVGDQLLIGPSSAGPFVNLSGPNNPEDNFFCSQINGADGMIDTSGSFGNMNHDAASGTNISGGRQSWDVTTVGVSSMDGQLDNNQTSAVFRTITTGDSYVPIVAAFAIDVNAPDFTNGSMFVPVPTTVHVGDDLELTLDVTNGGLVTASNVALELPLDPGLSLVSFKMQGHAGDINGNPVDTAQLASGAAAGDVAPGQSRHVVIDLHVDGPPAGSGVLVPRRLGLFVRRLRRRHADARSLLAVRRRRLRRQGERRRRQRQQQRRRLERDAWLDVERRGRWWTVRARAAAETAAATGSAVRNDAGNTGGCGCEMPGDARSPCGSRLGVVRTRPARRLAPPPRPALNAGRRFSWPDALGGDTTEAVESQTLTKAREHRTRAPR